MRIRREPAARFHLAAKIFQLLRGKTAFEKTASVNAGRGVTLKINGVAFEVLGASAEEMVEANFVKCCGGSVRGDVTADAVLMLIRANNHRERIPANQALNAALEGLVAWKRRL